MSQVQFEGDEEYKLISLAESQSKNKPSWLVELIINIGIVHNEKSANKIILGTTIVCLIFAAILFYINQKSVEPNVPRASEADMIKIQSHIITAQ